MWCDGNENQGCNVEEYRVVKDRAQNDTGDPWGTKTPQWSVKEVQTWELRKTGLGVAKRTKNKDLR